MPERKNTNPVMNPQKRFMRRSIYAMSLSAEVLVYNVLDLGKDCARRQHFAIFVGTVDPDELRVEPALLPVNVPDTLLELDVSFVDVLPAFEIIPVLSAALALELRLHEADRHVKEDVQVRNRQPETAVFCVEDPVPQASGLVGILELGALVGDVRVHIPVEEHGAAAGELFLHSRSGSMAVFCEEKGNELRMDRLVGAEVSAEETADEVAVDRGVIAREMYVFKLSENAFQIASELLYLC